jgi:DNA-binding response OmpR family regulator
MRKHDFSVKPRILVASEIPDLADVYGYLFTAAGYRVARAYDGLTAAALARVTKPDIAILNQHLPGLTGLGVLQELRAAGVGTKVIITSGMGEFAALAKRALAEGAEFCVRQPCPSERLLRMVAIALERPRLFHR